MLRPGLTAEVPLTTHGLLRPDKTCFITLTTELAPLTLARHTVGQLSHLLHLLRAPTLQASKAALTLGQ